MEFQQREILPGPALVGEGGTRTIWLRDPRRAWLIAAGTVDVFVVSLRDGVVSTGLRHLFRAEEGQLLLGMPWGADEDALALQVRGSAGVRLQAIALEQLRTMGAEPGQARQVAGWLDRWITAMASALAPELLPRRLMGLAPGDELVLLPDTYAAATSGVVWVEWRQGQLELLGEPAPQATDSALPLAGRLVACARQPCEIAVLDTAVCLRQGLTWAGLASLHALAYKALQTQLAQQAQAERARIEAITAIDQQTMSRSLRQLATVLAPAAATPARAEKEADQLIAACRAVGAAAGITIQKPAPAVSSAALRTPIDAIAQASRVRVRRVALRGEWWRRDNGPMIAAMAADRRPVALLISARLPYQLYDPGTGATRPVDAQVAAELEPFAHTFFRALPARAITPLEVLRFGMRGCERDIRSVLLISAGLGLLGLAAPIVTGVIIDSVIPAADGFKLLQLTLALVVAAFATALFQVVQRIALLGVEGRANTATQAAVWDRLLNMPVPFFRQYSAGDLATRVAGIDTIRQTLTGLTVSTLLSGLFALLNLGLLFAYEPRLALIALGLVLLTSAITTAAGYASLRYTRELSRMRARLAGLVLQFVTGIARLRVAGAERRAFAIWAEQFAAQRRVAFQARTISIGLGVFNSAYPTIALTILFAALAANPDGTRTTGTVLAFVAAFGGMLSAALGVSSSALTVLQVVPLVEHARPIFDTLPEVNPQRADPGVLRGGIKVDRITFRYQPDTAPILNDVSIEALPGEFVAIVGPSGSGKSTLLRMLLGFERPEAGAAYYDDNDLAGLDLQAVRRQIGVVLQSGKLMPGDIFSNIVGSALLTLDDAWEAAERAGLADDIRQMPMGMQTVIGEGGSTFSGGQRQRLMIARAIVNRPRILFFDEATSALDNRTQAIVSKSLDQLRATRVVIAHRLSTIMNADRIYVMVNGAVVQCGTFAELSTLEGPFHELVRRQQL